MASKFRNLSQINVDRKFVYGVRIAAIIMASYPVAAAHIAPIKDIEDFIIREGTRYQLISGANLKHLVVGYSIDAGISDDISYKKDGTYVAYTDFGTRKGRYIVTDKSVCRYDFESRKPNKKSCVSFYYANGKVVKIDKYSNNPFVRKRILLPQD